MYTKGSINIVEFRSRNGYFTRNISEKWSQDDSTGISKSAMWFILFL